MVRMLHRRKRNALWKICCMVIVATLIGVIHTASQTKKIKKEIQTEYIVDNQGTLIPDSTRIVKLYDKKQHVVEEKETSFWPALNKVVTYTKKHFYSVNGRYDSSHTFIDEKLSLTLMPRYDAAGRNIEEREITSNGTPGYRNRNYYNGNSRWKSRVELYAPDGKLYNFKSFTYDKKGNLIEESGSERGEPRYRWKSRYDSKNRLIERRDYSGKDAFMLRHEYEYNSEGGITRESVYDETGRRIRIMKYSYEYY